MPECERRDKHDGHAPIGFSVTPDEPCRGLPVDVPPARRVREVVKPIKLESPDA